MGVVGWTWISHYVHTVRTHPHHTCVSFPYLQHPAPRHRLLNRIPLHKPRQLRPRALQFQLRLGQCRSALRPTTAAGPRAPCRCRPLWWPLLLRAFVASGCCCCAACCCSRGGVPAPPVDADGRPDHFVLLRGLLCLCMCVGVWCVRRPASIVQKQVKPIKSSGHRSPARFGRCCAAKPRQQQRESRGSDSACYKCSLALIDSIDSINPIIPPHHPIPTTNN